MALEFARGLLDRAADPLGPTVEPEVVVPLLALKRPGVLCGAAVPKAAIEQLHRAAEMTLAHLPAELRRELWIERRWLECARGELSPAVSQRLDLYAAIAARDARAMLGRARTLLERESVEEGLDWGRFLLLSAMLGAHAAGEHEEAQRLWRTYATALYPKGRIPPSANYIVNLK
jgi:hypothetical protein